MFKLKIEITLLFLCGILGVRSEFPAGVEKCKYGDNVCITKQINYMAKNYKNGEEITHLADTNPIKFKNMHLKQGKKSPVDIDMTVKSGTIDGMIDCTYTKISGLGKDIKGPHTIYYSCPRVVLTGDYTIDGKILILPIRGNGVANLTTIGMNNALRFVGKPLEKNGKTYLDIGETKLKMNIKRLYMTFTNLFNDKALSDNMNKFLNENWEIIWSDLDEAIETSMGKIYKTVLKSVFDNVPYNELFLD